MNTLIFAKNNYQSLNDSDARALIYQKYLLSDSNDSKIEYLFLLEELFKKSNLINIYSDYLSKKIKEIGVDNLPERYKEVATSRLIESNNSSSKKLDITIKYSINQKLLNTFRG